MMCKNWHPLGSKHNVSKPKEDAIPKPEIILKINFQRCQQIDMRENLTLTGVEMS